MDILYKATAKNHLKWVSDGALNADFYVLAPDFMGALVKADAVVTSLREKLATHKSRCHPAGFTSTCWRLSVAGLRLTSLTEIGDVVDGAVMEHMPEQESWVDRTARQLTEHP